MVLQKIASRIIVPAQGMSKENQKENEIGRNNLINKYNGQEIFITAQDKIKLNGVLCKRPSRYWDFIFNLFGRKKIIVHFGGNGESYESFGFFPQYIQKAYRLGYDVLIFNYRNVGKSQGSPTPYNLVRDAEAVIDYAIEDLQYDPENIYVHGHSLGGAIATKAVSKNGYKVHLINDRSFSSIKDVIKTFNIRSLIKRILCFLLAIARWNIEVVEDWKKIKTKKILLVDKDDEVISEEGSLYHFVKDQTPKNQVFQTKGYGHCGGIFESNMRGILSRV